MEKLSFLFNYPLAKPRGGDLMITYHCNFRCSHCDIWKVERQRDLSAAEWFKIIDDLRNWLGPGYLVSVGGGEVLLRPDILEILDYLVKKDFQVILETNGSLIDDNKAEALVQMGLLEARVSLYSFSPLIHDSMRGIKEARAGASKALLLLGEKKKKFKSKIKISLALLLNKENIGEEAIVLINWARKNDFHVTVQALDENFKGDYQQADWHKNHPLWPNDELKIKSFFSWLLEMKKESGLIDNSEKTLLAFRRYFLEPASVKNLLCDIFYRTFNLDPGGRPFFCFKTGPIAESVRDFPAKKLWRSPALEEKRRAARSCSKICRLKCYYRDNWRDKIKSYLSA